MNYKSYTTADYDIPIKYIFSCSSIIHPHDMTQATQSLYIDALYYVNVGIELIQLSVLSYTVLIKNFFSRFRQHILSFFPRSLAIQL